MPSLNMYPDHEATRVQRNFFFLLKYLVLIFGLSSCATSRTPTTESSEKRVLATISATSADEDRGNVFNETILVGDSSGKLAILTMGKTLSRTHIKTSIPRAPVAIRVQNGKFHLLYNNGKLLILDPDQANIEQTINLPVKNPVDFIFTSDTTIYVSLQKTSKVVKIDLTSGAELASIDLSQLHIANGKIELHNMLLVGNNLFVQVARTKANRKKEQGALAVIDIATEHLKNVIELVVQDPKTHSALPGIEPRFPMVLDTKRNKLLVTLKGERPLNTGMIIRIDPETLEIYDFKKANAGFQGVLAFQEPFSKLFIIYHTSTPTTSSHLFVDLVDEDGTLTSASNRSLVDAFDGQDALAINQSGTLVAMANTCVSGLCLNGAGLSFVEVATNKVFPKLPADQIGFAPTLVHFK